MTPTVFIKLHSLYYRLCLFCSITPGIRSLAVTLRTECVDLWNGSSAISVDNDLYDGLHLGSEGNRKVFDSIRGVLSARYPYLDPATNDSDKQHGLVPLHFPHWSTIAGLTTEESKTVLDDWKWSTGSI